MEKLMREQLADQLAEGEQLSFQQEDTQGRAAAPILPSATGLGRSSASLRSSDKELIGKTKLMKKELIQATPLPKSSKWLPRE